MDVEEGAGRTATYTRATVARETPPHLQEALVYPVPVAPPRTHAPRHPRAKDVDGYPGTTARWARDPERGLVVVVVGEGASVYTPAALEAGARAGSRWSEAVLRAVTR